MGRHLKGTTMHNLLVLLLGASQSPDGVELEFVAHL